MTSANLQFYWCERCSSAVLKITVAIQNIFVYSVTSYHNRNVKSIKCELSAPCISKTGVAFFVV